MKYIGLALLIIVAIVFFLLLIAVIHTFLIPNKKSEYVAPSADTRAEEYAKKLSKMIQCETVSSPELDDYSKFTKFHKLLEEMFPLVHQHLEKNVIEGGNLLYKWKGKSDKKPLVLMSHQDVVPVEGEWIHEPFSGDIADGKVWGRGASDTKCSVMGFFQAIEELLADGYVPENDVYLSSSCTEEWAGPGCPAIVDELERRGVKPFVVCDEGGGIITEPVGGIHGNFAMMGVFEKGKGDVKFTAKSNGGHSSTPPKNSPVARIAAFVNEIETKDPFNRKMPAEVQSMFERLAPYAGFGLKLVFTNLWLFKPVLLKLLPAISGQAGAMIRTTMAFTMASGSEAYNVMPAEATLGCNLRFIPHQGMDESLDVIRKLAQKHDLEMEVIKASDYTKAVDINGDGFRLVEECVRKTFPGLPTSPYVMTGATDSANYQRICDNVIRFAPVIYGPEQMKGMHGINENIEYNCLPGAVDFYKNLIGMNV